MGTGHGVYLRARAPGELRYARPDGAIRGPLVTMQALFEVSTPRCPGRQADLAPVFAAPG
jgi:hypothetical protein